MTSVDLVRILSMVPAKELLIFHLVEGLLRPESNLMVEGTRPARR